MFQVEQTYDLASLTALCRAARKTVRRSWTRVLRGVCWGIFAVGTTLCLLLLALGEAPELWMAAVFAALLLLLVLEDRLNAWIARRQMVPGTARSVTVFDEDGYTVTTDASQTRWPYGNITYVCETERYFFFFLGKRHGQIFDKQGFQLGDPDAFRTFVEQKTRKSFEKIR